ncbi:MAG TPA: class I SAM-dependent methyltransferase [Thermoanaerobaculia bacterium]
MAHPLVREYINGLISGIPGGGLWPLDWFQRAYPQRRFSRGLSVGCGTGALERDVLRRELCDTMDAFDASTVSLDIARREAASAGIADRVRYYHADFNRVSLPRSAFEVVFFHQSLHHVSRVERLLRQVMHALKPGGLLYLDEYVGPSRTYWRDDRIAFYRALYHFLPRGMRFFDEFAMPIQYDDLSEAIRSGEIRSRLRIGFNVLHERGYGGNVLAMMFPDLDVARLTDDVVTQMIDAERSMLQSGMPSFHAIIVAAPKSSTLARTVARFRYLAEPKLKRIVRELQRLRKPASDVADPWY